MVGKVEEEIDRKVTLVALRSFLFGDGELDCWIVGLPHYTRGDS